MNNSYNVNKPERPTDLQTKILFLLANNQQYYVTFGSSYINPTVQSVFPAGASEETQFHYMRFLQSIDLVTGCEEGIDCDCGGDYRITLTGLKLLSDRCILGAKRFDEFIAIYNELDEDIKMDGTVIKLEKYKE